MKKSKLTKEEVAHINNGGRVFLVEEIPGPLWRILSISKERGTTLLCNPTIPKEEEGYNDFEHAKGLAYAIANLSEDSPMVRVCV